MNFRLLGTAFGCAFALVLGQAGAATITQLSSFSDFQSTVVTIEDFDTSLSDRTEFTFDSTASQFPANTNQLPRSGLTFFAEVGSNMPLFAEFHVDVYEVGFYAGNDDRSLWGFAQWFHLDAYGEGGSLLGSITVNANVNDAIDQFVGLRSDEVLTRIGIRFVGTNSLNRPSLAIDDFGVGYEPIPASVIPEPGTAVLLTMGVAMAGMWKKRRNNPAN